MGEKEIGRKRNPSGWEGQKGLRGLKRGLFRGQEPGSGGKEHSSDEYYATV